MDNKERFDQIENLLVGVMQRMERLEQLATRQEQFNAGLSDQIGDIINILKMSNERQTQADERQRQADERQEKLMRRIEEQGRRTDATQTEILRMLAKWDEQDARNEAVEKRLDNHEPRIQRLEDDALRQAS